MNTSVQRMRELYEAVGINVQLASTENLNLPDLNDVDVGKCQMGTTTDEQDDLSPTATTRTRTTSAPTSSAPRCHLQRLRRPSGQPSALVVAQGATQWTLAHEAGHVLSLGTWTTTTG